MKKKRKEREQKIKEKEKQENIEKKQPKTVSMKFRALNCNGRTAAVCCPSSFGFVANFLIPFQGETSAWTWFIFLIIAASDCYYQYYSHLYSLSFQLTLRAMAKSNRSDQHLSRAQLVVFRALAFFFFFIHRVIHKLVYVCRLLSWPPLMDLRTDMCIYLFINN